MSGHKSANKRKIDAFTIILALFLDKLSETTPSLVKVAEHLPLLIDGGQPRSLGIIMAQSSTKVVGVVNTHHQQVLLREFALVKRHKQAAGLLVNCRKGLQVLGDLMLGILLLFSVDFDGFLVDVLVDGCFHFVFDCLNYNGSIYNC